MIYDKDCICRMNVYSKIYKGHYLEMKSFFEDYADIIMKHHLRRDGEMFYTFNQLTETLDVELEIFQATKEYISVLDTNVRFYSYYCIENMLSTVITNDFDKIQLNYAEIVEYMRAQNRVESSNTYTEIHSNGTQKYIILKIGERI
ncbi:MAG: DUF5085 family protein [Lachnospiraceae bacterium]